MRSFPSDLPEVVGDTWVAQASVAVQAPGVTMTWFARWPYRFATQRYHYLIRTAHILSMALFFGGIRLLDLRLVGWRGTVPLKPFAEHVLPWLYGTFVVSVATGVLLFLYDPVHAGSRAYWTPKLIAIALGLANAALYHRTGYVAVLPAEARVPTSARVAGALTLICWSAAVVFAPLNTEAMPRVILR